VALVAFGYLRINYRPTLASAECQLTLDNNGRQLLEEHRESLNINNMKSTFNYLKTSTNGN
jgi:hypothetical protein